MELSRNELRVIGCLMEKSITTPDQYPLSVNALTNACNQKSNRDPVLSLSEMEVQDIVDALMEARLIIRQAGVTSRVAKYQHRFCNTEFSDLQFGAQELGVLCVLFLRGPQTPGELRTRTQRLCQFNNVQETESVLSGLANAEKGPYVTKLHREPGRRESRYQHCFGEDIGSYKSEMSVQDSVDGDSRQADLDNALDSQDLTQTRLKALEETVELMQMELEELRERLASLG